MKLTVEDCAKMIDHSLLHPTMTDEDLRTGCEIARRYCVATVCVKPYAVPLAKELLSRSGVAICTVIGFPHGNSTTAIKDAETREACLNGAEEIDMVVNIGKVLGGDWDYVEAEIRKINDTARNGSAILKVIFENDFLEDRHIVKLCEICTAAGAAFVKTSTGYGFVRQADGSYATKGATLRHLTLMREHAGPNVGIKAAGGVRTLDSLLAVRAIGVTRIGATATETILEEAMRRVREGIELETN